MFLILRNQERHAVSNIIAYSPKDVITEPTATKHRIYIELKGGEEVEVVYPSSAERDLGIKEIDEKVNAVTAK